ncbi:hypothetical protein IKG54_00975, partial [Candidatus Saccharibacteria bacterium]|nr:hypothetical protein [Candidatus Saccharibacteria bacterium]
SLVTNTYIAPVGNTTTSSLNSATALSNNTWGFALSSTTPGIVTNNFNTASEYESESQATINSNRYTTVPTNNNQVLLLQDTEPTSTTTIYYGVKADRDIPAGSYSNTVLYTALAEQPSEIRVSGPNGLNPTIDLNSPHQTLTIYTSINTTSSELGIATVSFTNSSNKQIDTCSNVVLNTDSDNYLYLTCTSPAMPADIYDVTVTLDTFGRVLEADGVVTYSGTPPINTITTMQTLTADACKTAPFADTAGNNIYTLKDSRDNKSYKIAHLADGNCWMVSNLALDGSRTLQPTDSNVTENRTLPANISGATTSQYDVAQIYSGNASSTTTSCSSSYPDCIVSDIKYGNLYNWNAATAGVGKQATTGTVTESVCPKGWQLPNNIGDNSFNALMSAYSLPTTNGTDHFAVQTIQQSPLNFPLVGYYLNDVSYVVRVAVYWSNTVYPPNKPDAAYSLSFDAQNGGFAPQDNTSRRVGASVRCVFGG